MITTPKSYRYYTTTFRDKNPIRTLGDYSGPSHEGYQNTIELLDRNNMVPLRSDTIRKHDSGKSTGKREAIHPITKNINTISLVKMEKEKNIENNEVVDKNVIELGELDDIKPKEVVDMKKEVEDRASDETVRNVDEEITGDGIEELVEMPRSQPVGYYFKHEINEKLIEGLRGIAEDVLVEIAGYIYPVDFMILDVKKDKKKPFILGKPFLTTAKVDIRVEKGIKNDIDPVAPTTT
nr:hypothetical protein [Tanacetum cinerariifolium]